MAQSKRTLTQADAVFLLKVFSELFASIEDLEDVKEKISHLPTKDEFYESQDKIAARLDKIYENTDLLPDQISGHERRLIKIEEQLHIAT